MGKRQDGRERIEAQIVEVGRRHLISDGAAALSLRAIARELGMVSSAVYRYVASRDDLLTLLLVDAYTDLADTVDIACASAAAQSPGSWRAGVDALAHAARRWALGKPASWSLLYGSPVPGYHAPADTTVGPGTRVVGALFAIVDKGVAEGSIESVGLVVPQPLSSDFDRLRAEFGFTGNDGALARCFAVWAGLIGAISLEVFGQYGADTLTDPDLVFDLQVRLLLDLLDN